MMYAEAMQTCCPCLLRLRGRSRSLGFALGPADAPISTRRHIDTRPTVVASWIAHPKA